MMKVAGCNDCATLLQGFVGLSSSQLAAVECEGSINKVVSLVDVKRNTVL